MKIFVLPKNVCDIVTGWTQEYNAGVNFSEQTDFFTFFFLFFLLLKWGIVGAI